MFSPDNTPRLDGKIAVITGANSGLGRETAGVFAAKGAHVILASRNLKKGEAAKAEILQKVPNGAIEVMELDLASLTNIMNFCREVSRQYPKIDLLINNAGLMALPESTTEDGFETQFGVNHLGHWALTGLLMPLLKKGENPRIVTVTSSAHHMVARINFKDPHSRKKYSPWIAYAQSKLANYYFALGLHRKLEKVNSPIMSLLAHPGLAQTNLQVETARLGGAGKSGQYSEDMVKKYGMSAYDGAMPQIRAALDPNAKSGEFYAPRYLGKGPAVKRPFLRPFTALAIRKLWELSEKETGISIQLD